MKILSVIVALFVVVEIKAHDDWMTYGPNIGNVRRSYPNQNSWWPYPQQQNQNNGFDSNVEWVCRNPRTNDMMIIATDDTRHTYPTRKPWQWHNPSGPSGQHWNHGHQHGNDWTGPVIIIEQEQGNQFPTLRPDNHDNNNNNNNNNNPTQTTTPRYHGGEGMIDIRVGENNN